MKTHVSFLSILRQPFKSILFIILFGLISFGFMAKAVEFILIQRETGTLGSYYRSIGVLENIKDPRLGDISAGINLIETSPSIAYGDPREIVSGVMPDTYNENRIDTNVTIVMEALPPEAWPNTHTYDLWFVGDLIKMEELQTLAKQPQDKRTIGYYLQFNVDTLFAADPKYAVQGKTIALLFFFEGHESDIPTIQAMEVGQRYFLRGWDDSTTQKVDLTWENIHSAFLEIRPLEDGQRWYIPIANGENADFSNPALAPFKNEIDVLNENLHTLGIIATADQSAMPQTQEASRFYYLTTGRWLNHQDDLAGSKVIVVPESFATLRHLKLGDTLTFTFRPLTDTYFGLIRDGVDSQNWHSYPTYQDTFEIVGLYGSAKRFAYYAYIPTNSLRPGFASSFQGYFGGEADYSFVLDSSRHETEFTQTFRDSLEKLGIKLTFLPNNGPAYWASVDPIRRSLSADLLVYGLLMVGALVLAVFLYVLIHKRNYAIQRALGVPVRSANRQTIWPMLFLGGIGILLGGLPAWNYAIRQAKVSLSTLPLPSGVTPPAHLSVFVLAGLFAASFLFLALFTWMGMFLLSRKPVFELLQGQASRSKERQKLIKISTEGESVLISSSPEMAVPARQMRRERPADLAFQRKYPPTSLGQYVVHHMLRSSFKSCLILAVALGFLLATGWIRQTMIRSQLQVDRLYDTTTVDADIILADRSANPTRETGGKGSGFVYRNTVKSVLDSGFVKSSVLEADTIWTEIGKYNSEDTFPGYFQVYAYDSPETFNSGLTNPGSLVFAPGWDMALFAQPRQLGDIQNEGVPALFPQRLLEQLQVQVGEAVRIKNQSGRAFRCIVAGQYTGGMAAIVNSTTRTWINPAGNYILIPISVMEAMDGTQTKFTLAHFSLDPAKNRELDQLRAVMEKPMALYGNALRFMIWDEELRLVVAQLEKNISLLQVLYPVVLGVSVLIGAGLCFLLLLQAAREAALLRVLGTTRTSVRLALTAEPFCLSLLGMGIGLALAHFIGMISNLGSSGPLLVSAGLYLVGVLAGSVMGAVSVTNKKPIELLQVKE